MSGDPQAETVAFLSHPAAYGGIGPVQRIDTHISTIFLVGDRAYKLKRAVAFAYLDFTRAETRRACCLNEVAINRRTAPQIYLGVAPIVRSAAGALAIGETGADPPGAVDWLVVMRRFDQEALFDALARAGRLELGLMTDLADAIAGFHRDAERSARGGASAIVRVIAGIEREIRRAVPETFTAADAERIAAAWHAEAGRLSSLLDARRDEGKVRRCHGDLHLRNICLIGNSPVLFDAIEFSEDIATIDVLYDVAFLLMDLDHRGLRRLANAVINRYLEGTGDYGGLAALPLFLSLRAGVRAHTSAAAPASDASVDREQRQDEARAYLAFAGELLRQRPRAIIAIGGLSGTGKSTLAREIAPDFGRSPGALVLRSDVMRKSLFGRATLARLDATAYAESVTERVYALLGETAQVVFAAGYCAIVDAVFAREAQRSNVADMATALGAPFIGLWLDAPESVRRSRVESRVRDASDATPDVVAAQETYELGRIDWQRLDASFGLATILGAARQGIESRLR